MRQRAGHHGGRTIAGAVAPAVAVPGPSVRAALKGERMSPEQERDFGSRLVRPDAVTGPGHRRRGQRFTNPISAATAVKRSGSRSLRSE
ncbi:hypothetical protein OPKNFCMD_0092 [Methylobacterium crusticola]|uniref:Uncharacterized protein n=1 Tax=Methylobacterium crusticola TaxID=1697972 RepID=A0ABQ4QQ23_9HYPH|nr:hypothetical protein OPKNFCMD_0092 [Methylobacterium crusticola]